MANKGPLDATIDVGALNEIIVYANRYTAEIDEKGDEIRKICMAMAKDESLTGGDGDVIRENFLKIAAGCSNLSKSNQIIVNILNKKLSTSIQMRHGQSVGNSSDAIDSAVKKVGVKKE